MELTIFNASGSSEGINAIKLSKNDADSIFKLLLELGATKDIRFMWDEDRGSVHIMKRIYMDIRCDESGNPIMNPEQMYSLHDYIKLLSRFDRSAHKRMNNVKNKINAMYQAINSLEKQL